MPTPLPPFTIDQPSSLAEAARSLVASADESRAYAGGTELLLVMKHGGLRYDRLVDLKTVPGLDAIEERDGAIWIGALTTHLKLERSPLIGRRLPALADLERKVANPRVRSTGTIGGNLCFAEPHSDPATLLLCLAARLHVVGPDGERVLPVDELIVGPYETSLGDGELLRVIEIPLAACDWRAEYRKFQVRERPMLGLALALDVDPAGPADQSIRGARVAVGSVSPSPRRVPEAEALLVGSLVEAAGRLPDAAAAVAEAAELLDDLDGSAEYKRHLIGVLLRQAFERLSGPPAPPVPHNRDRNGRGA
jgi:carbon-monoxide dehydrogenase medium subunit